MKKQQVVQKKNKVVNVYGTDLETDKGMADGTVEACKRKTSEKAEAKIYS